MDELTIALGAWIAMTVLGLAATVCMLLLDWLRGVRDVDGAHHGCSAADAESRSSQGRAGCLP